MSSNTDPGDGGKGALQTKPKVKGGYQQRYHEPRRKKKNPATIRPARATFSGLIEDLKGRIYNVRTGSQENQCTATTKSLASYAGRKCANPQDIWLAIELQKGVSTPIPTTRTDIDEEVEISSLERRSMCTPSAVNSTAKTRRKYTPWPWDNAQRLRIIVLRDRKHTRTSIGILASYVSS